MDPSAEVADDAVVTHSIVGAHVRVESDASVIDSVLLPGASVGRGATIERALVMGAVGAGAVVRDAMIGVDGRVGDGEALIEGTSPAVPA